MGMIAGAVLFNAAGSTAVRQLATIDGLQWLDDIDAEGSFSFRIPVEDATGLEIGSVIKIYLGETTADYVFAGSIENIKLEKSGQTSNGVARSYDVSGRGIKGRLEDAIVYPVGSSTTREITNQTAGDAFLTFFDEAQLRGALANFSTDFTASTDSNGDPYDITITTDEKVGTTLLEVANRHQELAVDFWVTADQVIHYANTRGIDRTTGSNPTVLRVGQSISDMTGEASGPIRNTVLVGSGQDGATFNTRADIGSQIAYGRRETFLALANTSDSAQVELAADNMLENTANPSDGITIELSDTGPIPYIDYDLGDWILIADETGARTQYRLRAITVSQNPDGTLKFVPELGTVRADLDRRLNRALKRIERGVPDGTVLAAATPSDYDFGAAGVGALTPGTVVTYTSATTSGTVDIDGDTVNFYNASSVRLEVGDEILLVTADGYPDPIAVALYDRTGGPAGYDTYEFVVPHSVPGLPRTLPYILGDYSTFSGDYGTIYDPGNQDSDGDRVLVPNENTSSIQIENWSTGTTSSLPLPISSGWYSNQVIASPTVIAFVAAGGPLRVHYAGVTTIYNYSGVTLAGVDNGTIIAVATANTSGTPGVFLLEIDATGAVIEVDETSVWIAATGGYPSGARFARANDNYRVIAWNNYLYINGTITFGVPAAPASLPLYNPGGSNNVPKSLLQSDIVDNFLYWGVGTYVQTNNLLTNTATPSTAVATIPAGFARMNLNAPGIIDYFPNIVTATGAASDGEPTRITSLAALADGRVILGGAVWTGYISPGVLNENQSSKCSQAAYWISNGVTTQAFVPGYPLLDPATQLYPTNFTNKENSIATVSTDQIGSEYTVVYRRDLRNSSIIDGGAI